MNMKTTILASMAMQTAQGELAWRKRDYSAQAWYNTDVELWRDDLQALLNSGSITAKDIHRMLIQAVAQTREGSKQSYYEMCEFLADNTNV